MNNKCCTHQIYYFIKIFLSSCQFSFFVRRKINLYKQRNAVVVFLCFLYCDKYHIMNLFGIVTPQLIISKKDNRKLFEKTESVLNLGDVCGLSTRQQQQSEYF